MTGASSGIGEASAIAFAQQGARVVVAARRTEVVVVLDDHVPADAYWACFQATAERF